MAVMAKVCLDFFIGVCSKPLNEWKTEEITDYAPFLLLSTLILVSCPRSQVLKHLNWGGFQAPKTLFLEQHGYVIRMSATMSKDSKPVVLAINEKLTQAYTFYLEHIPPTLLSPKFPDQGYIFIGLKNGPRHTFKEWTSRLSMKLCLKSFTPKDLRTATVSLYYEGKSNLSELDLIHLSTTMNHSVDTAIGT